MPRSLVALLLCFTALAGCAVATSGTSTPTIGADQAPVTVSRPDGSGPFPAVVVMHDCSGLGPRSSGAPGRWAKELVGRGYVVVMPDSFTPRGHADGVCRKLTEAARAAGQPVTIKIYSGAHHSFDSPRAER